MVSAQRSVSSPWGVLTVYPRSVCNGWGSAVQTRTTDGGTPMAVRSTPQTSQGTAISNAERWSNASTATRCGRPLWSTMAGT